MVILLVSHWIWITELGQFFKNGVGGEVKTLVDTDSGSTVSITELYPYVGSYSSDFELNFGQKPFKFPPPDGFQPLNAANVRPETVISRPDQYVGIITYVGDGGGYKNIYWFKLWRHSRRCLDEKQRQNFLWR